jgi:Mg-chelatase subunit ChlD
MIARRVFLKSAFLSAATLPLSFTAPAFADEKKPDEKKPEAATPTAPQVEVVFCLDTTGSMGGLIEGAKQKIWAICNQIAGGRPSPDLKVGLVAYRDRGDEYITKVFDLTEDLDAIHGHLRGFKAQGGGDPPESVNEALHVTVNKIKWSKSDEVLKIIFLVGDAPPHMDYPDDVKYPITCQQAAKLGILINTVQCGNDADCKKYWQDIARKAEGQYVQIAQDGGVVAVATPFDKRLSEINADLTRSTVCYGTWQMQQEGQAKANAALQLAAPAAAERAAFNAKKDQNAHFDLLDAVKQNRVKLEELKKDQLPPEMQKMTLAEQKAHLEKIEKERTELRKEAVELDKKRSDFIARKLAETKGKDGFDQQVLEMLRKQATKVKIVY